MTDKPVNALLKQTSALGSYLDDMLQSATESVPLSDAESPVENIGQQSTEALLVEDISPQQAELPQFKVDTDHAVGPEVESAVPATDEIADRSIEATVEAQPITSEEAEVESTALSADMFPMQCLMFSVADNLLSIPLTKMHSVLKWPQNLSRLPHHPDWILGLFQYRERNLTVIDSASIMRIKVTTEAPATNILVLEEGVWGLSCCDVDKVVTLQYDDIQWHQTPQTDLIAGTIRNSLASLVNPDALTNYLQSMK